MSESPYMTTADVRAAFGVGAASVMRWRKAGLLATAPGSTPKHPLYLREQVRLLVAGDREGAMAAAQAELERLAGATS